MLAALKGELRKLSFEDVEGVASKIAKLAGTPMEGSVTVAAEFARAAITAAGKRQAVLLTDAGGDIGALTPQSLATVLRQRAEQIERRKGPLIVEGAGGGSAEPQAATGASAGVDLGWLVPTCQPLATALEAVTALGGTKAS